MAIQIKELLASDSLANALEKINYNFDQLILSGGGPAGPLGLQGINGVPGVQGQRGGQWFTEITDGATATLSAGVFVGDLWLESDGDVWQYGTTGWVFTGENIKGIQGDTGDAGAESPFKVYEGNGTFYIPDLTNPNHHDGADLSDSCFITLNDEDHKDPSKAYGYNIDTLLLGAAGDLIQSQALSNYTIPENETPKLILLQRGTNASNGISLGIGGEFSTFGNEDKSSMSSRDFSYIGIDDTSTSELVIQSTDNITTKRVLSLKGSQSTNYIKIGIDVDINTGLASFSHANGGNSIHISTNGGEVYMDSDVSIRNENKLKFYGNAGSVVTGITSFRYEGTKILNYILPETEAEPNLYLTESTTNGQLEWKEIGWQSDGSLISLVDDDDDVTIGGPSTWKAQVGAHSTTVGIQTGKLNILGENDAPAIKSKADRKTSSNEDYGSTLVHSGSYLSMRPYNTAGNPGESTDESNDYGTGSNGGFAIQSKSGARKGLFRHFSSDSSSTDFVEMLSYTGSKIQIQNQTSTDGIHLMGNVKINKASNDYTLPTIRGNNLEVLSTDGNGTASWTNVNNLPIAASVWSEDSNHVSLTNSRSKGVLIEKNLDFSSTVDPSKSLSVRDMTYYDGNNFSLGQGAGVPYPDRGFGIFHEYRVAQGTNTSQGQTSNINLKSGDAVADQEAAAKNAAAIRAAQLDPDNPDFVLSTSDAASLRGGSDLLDGLEKNDQVSSSDSAQISALKNALAALNANETLNETQLDSLRSGKGTLENAQIEGDNNADVEALKNAIDSLNTELDPANPVSLLSQSKRDALQAELDGVTAKSGAVDLADDLASRSGVGSVKDTYTVSRRGLLLSFVDKPGNWSKMSSLHDSSISFTKFPDDDAPENVGLSQADEGEGLVIGPKVSSSWNDTIGIRIQRPPEVGGEPIGMSTGLYSSNGDCLRIHGDQYNPVKPSGQSHGYISFYVGKDNGLETNGDGSSGKRNGWIGYGSTNNEALYIKNETGSIGPRNTQITLKDERVTIDKNLTVNNNATVSNSLDVGNELEVDGISVFNGDMEVKQKILNPGNSLYYNNTSNPGQSYIYDPGVSSAISAGTISWDTSNVIHVANFQIIGGVVHITGTGYFKSISGSTLWLPVQPKSGHNINRFVGSAVSYYGNSSRARRLELGGSSGSNHWTFVNEPNGFKEQYWEYNVSYVIS